MSVVISLLSLCLLSSLVGAVPSPGCSILGLPFNFENQLDVLVHRLLLLESGPADSFFRFRFASWSLPPHQCHYVLPAPGLPAKKANECQYKLCPFTPTEEAKETKLQRLAPKHATDYYNKIYPEHKKEMDEKKAAKIKAKSKAKNIQEGQDRHSKHAIFGPLLTRIHQARNLQDCRRQPPSWLGSTSGY